MYKISNNFSPPRMNEVLEVRNEHPYNLKQGPSVFQALSNINILQHWNSFLFRVKSLGYTPKHLQTYRLSRQIQKGYKNANLKIVQEVHCKCWFYIEKECLNYF